MKGSSESIGSSRSETNDVTTVVKAAASLASIVRHKDCSRLAGPTFLKDRANPKGRGEGKKGGRDNLSTESTGDFCPCATDIHVEMYVHQANSHLKHVILQRKIGEAVPEAARARFGLAASVQQMLPAVFHLEVFEAQTIATQKPFRYGRGRFFFFFFLWMKKN